MARLAFLWIACATAALIQAGEPALERFEFTRTEMAIPIRIVLYTPDNATATAAANAAFDRFRQLNAILSDYDPQSELRKLCDTSREGAGVHVSDDLWRVLSAAEHFAKISDGAFDITIGPVVKLWRNVRRTKELPRPGLLQAALSRVGYRNVRLLRDQQAVELLLPRMQLDLGGIGKGYAVDEALKVLRQHGVTRMMIDAGGNIGLGDPPPNRSGWRIGVAPLEVNKPPREYLCLAHAAVSTSGDLWQHAVIEGVRYSHLIDPRTGMALTDQSSVTVVCPDGIDADGLSSAAVVLGFEEGVKLIDETPGAAALFVQMIDSRQQVRESKRWCELPHPQ